MKYLSLIQFMKKYAQYAKVNRRFVGLPWDEVCHVPEEGGKYNPFRIVPETDSDTQPMNRIFRHGDISTQFSRTNIPGMCDLPPILEMEWLNGKLDLGEEIMDVLNQLSYYMVIVIMGDMNNAIPGQWKERLEEEDVIIEVEELEDAGIILLQKKGELPLINDPRTREYNAYFYYKNTMRAYIYDFMQFANSETKFARLYLHLPVILSMFMIDYYGNKLKYWNEETRITVENKLQKLVTTYNFHVANDELDLYTYARCNRHTNKDRDLFTTVMQDILTKLLTVNSDMGIISIWTYTHVTGPERRHASIQIASLNANWKDEISEEAMRKMDENRKEEVVYE